MFSKKCRLLTLEIMVLLIIGIVMVGSSSRVWAAAKFQDATYFMSRQAVFALLGLFVMYVASRISLVHVRRYAKRLFLLCVVALILVLIPGVGVLRNGSRSWFGVGSFLIQPSEFFKIAIIIYVADYLAKRYRIKSFRDVYKRQGYLAMNGIIEIGDITAFIQYVRSFNQPIAQLAQTMNVMQSTAAAAERVFEFLAEEEEVAETKTPQPIAAPDVYKRQVHDAVFSAYEV